MLKRTVRAILNRLGVSVYRLPSDRVLPLDYPVQATPRWGHGRPPHPQIGALFERHRGDFARVLRDVAAQAPIFRTIPAGPSEEHPASPFWDNSWFPPLDAGALIGFLVTRRPKLYLEIGSGQSTKFARHAIRHAGLDTRIVSIDPSPRSEVDAICDTVVRSRLEDCDASVFKDLRAGDILFFDGSHRVFTNSDVTIFFLEILPVLCPGVLVHVHDVFWPADYPDAWRHRYYSEQYLLGVLLMCPAPPIRVVLPNYFVATDPQLRAIVSEVPQPGAESAATWLRYAGMATPACSFWFETL